MAKTKANIAEKLYNEIGLNKRESKEFVESFFNELNNTLEEGEEIKLSGFGNFSLRHKTERIGRNPRTGEEKIISARRVVTFKTGQKLKSRVEIYSEKSTKN